VRALREIERVLTPYYGADCPVVVAYRVGWPDQMFIRGTLGDIRLKVRDEKITRTALILVGPVLGQISEFTESALYDPAMPHVLRPKVTERV
jgi:precorrin-4/cobalt-precorrin-4 C11-methyltransferase